MTATEVVLQFIQWRQLEYRREVPNQRHHDRTGSFTANPLPAGHTAGDYQVFATNTATNRDRGWTEAERAVFMEGLRTIETVLNGMSGFATVERECERKGDWQDIDFQGPVRVAANEVSAFEAAIREGRTCIHGVVRTTARPDGTLDTFTSPPCAACCRKSI